MKKSKYDGIFKICENCGIEYQRNKFNSKTQN